MPIPKRWHPVSHDLPLDPELWELIRLHGDRSVLTWLWILSAIDRSGNHLRLSGDWLASLSRMLRQSSASIRRQLDWMITKGWLTVVQTSPDGSPAVLSANNYWKYHRSREPKGSQPGTVSGADVAPLLSEPILDETNPPPKPPEGDALARFEEFRKLYPERDGRKVGIEQAREEFYRLSVEDQARCIVATRAYSKFCREGDRKPKDPNNFLRDQNGVEPWREFIPAQQAPMTPKPPAPPTQTRPLEDIRKDLEKTPNGRHYLAMAERNGDGREDFQTSAEQVER